MPVIGLLGYIVFALLAFGLRRQAIHYHRTGTQRLCRHPRLDSGLVEMDRRGAVRRRRCWPLSPLPLLEARRRGRSLSVTLDTAQCHTRWETRGIQPTGVLPTLWAQLAMGDSWRVGVEHGTSGRRSSAPGPFRWVRNPIFTSMTLATLGLAGLVVPQTSLSFLALAHAS